MTDYRCTRIVLAAWLAAISLGAIAAHASEPYCPPGQTRVWYEPVYRTVAKQVWCEPVYQTVARQVWCAPVTYQKPCVSYDHCGKAVTSYQTVVVTPGQYKAVYEKALVQAGQYKTVQEQVLVEEGHYKTVQEEVLVQAGYYNTVQERVLVRAGYWATKRNY